MQTTVVKWGNSQGVRIPKAFLKSMEITENDPVDVILENERIIIKKSNVVEHKTIKKRLTEFYGEDFARKREPQEEINWGAPVGKEIW